MAKGVAFCERVTPRGASSAEVGSAVAGKGFGSMLVQRDLQTGQLSDGGRRKSCRLQCAVIVVIPDLFVPHS